jgi:carboxymethylenebutenolidase
VRLDSGWVQFPVGETTAAAYRARPEAAGSPLPAVVLVQEVWGVDEFIMDVAHRFAAAGYLAFAPDLYSLGGARPPELAPEAIQRAKEFLDTVPPSSWWDAGAREKELAALPAAQARELRATFDRILDWGDLWDLVDLLRAAVAAAGADAAGSGWVGVAGWCRGGALVGRLACREPELKAAVIFYGAAPDDRDVPGIACPVLGFYGGADPVVSQGVPGFAAAMRAADKQFAWHIYDGAPHAFFNDTRAAYTVSAARDAWAQTLAFLAGHVGQPGGAHGGTS